MANDCIPTYEPGARITGHAGTAVTGSRFVAITGNRTSGPGLADTAEGGNVTIGPAAVAGRIFGVAAHDAAAGGKVAVIRQAVCPVSASAAITAFAEVQVGAGGTAVPRTTGVAVGFALSGAAIGADAEIALYV